jgi:ribosome maturation factor RimP
MQKAPAHLSALVRRTVEGLGYELVGVELLPRPKAGHLLRVYLDAPDGVTLDDCARASHQLSGMLDVEDPISGEYALEVSSPGLDRPLFEAAQFARFVGRLARVRLNGKLNGRSNWKGAIVAVEGDEVLLQVDDETVRLPVSQMASARLVADI